jgi:hypothetical protein
MALQKTLKWGFSRPRNGGTLLAVLAKHGSGALKADGASGSRAHRQQQCRVTATVNGDEEGDAFET